MKNPSSTGIVVVVLLVVVVVVVVVVAVVVVVVVVVVVDLIHHAPNMDVKFDHRDISWGNIMMRNDENGRLVAKLVDLGKLCFFVFFPAASTTTTTTTTTTSDLLRIKSHQACPATSPSQVVRLA